MNIPYLTKVDHSEYGTIQDHTGSYRSIRDLTGPHEASRDHSGTYGTLMDLFGSYGTLRDLAGPYRTVQDHCVYYLCKKLQLQIFFNRRTDLLTDLHETYAWVKLIAK